MIIKITNFLIFQIGWTIAVYMHDRLAAAICCLLSICNYVLTKQYSLRCVVAIVIVTLLGITNDFLLLKFGLISFSQQNYIIFPLWLAALWLLFISTFNSSLQWLQSLSVTPLALLGGVGGAVSYWVGSWIGAMQYQGVLVPQLVLHFINWLVLFPTLYKLYWTISKST